MSGRRDTTLLRVRGLELVYGPKTVLAGVNLEVRTHQRWFLLGPNGSGKTTLLRAILGLVPPRRGELELHSDLADRRRVGFVPQRCDLNPSLSTTVREFVLLGLVGTRIAGPERDENLRWALDRVGLGGLERADHWALSGGQHQRMLVARALVRRPSVLILDEPTEGFDVGTEDALLRTLAELNRSEGVTLLFVTHKLNVAARFATHVALFHDGSVSSGPRREVLRRTEVERIFGIAAALADDAVGAEGEAST